MTKLYLVRHAEAEGNLYRRIHGQYDSLLTENGYRQLEKLEERFADIPVDAVYASDLFRAAKTAEVIARPKGLPLMTRADLREISVGDWEDKTWGEVDYRNRQEMLLFCQNSPRFQPKGGEGFAQVRARVSAAFLDIAAKHPNQTVVVVSHGTAIRNAFAVFMGLDLEESNRLGHSDNTAVSLLEVQDGKVHIVYTDDNSHLPKEISTLARQGWWKNQAGTSPDENIWYEPMDLSQESGRNAYVAARRDAWNTLHNDLDRFYGDAYLEHAMESWCKNPHFLLHAMQKGRKIGVLEMNPERDAQEGAGYISFLYLFPETRCHGLGVQLLGQAISTYRPMGRTKLKLACSEKNYTARRFYERYSFRKCGEIPGAYGILNLMEKEIGHPKPGDNT